MRSQAYLILEQFRDDLTEQQIKLISDQLSRKLAAPPAKPVSVETIAPRVIDNDKDEITVSLDGKEIRGWSYADEAQRRTKMLCAREFIEGFCTGREA
jgi:hypothetical protein